MNNIRKALRYIYIYILTHAKAGWAYDRQSREVWERRNGKDNDSKHYYNGRGDLHVLRTKRRGDTQPEEPISSRCGEYARSDQTRNSDKFVCERSNLGNDRRRRRVYLSCERLTSKEVAA